MLKLVIGMSSCQWMDSLCKSFIFLGDYQDLLKAHAVVEALSECMHKIPSSSCWVSSGSDIPESPLSKCIYSVVNVLEDLLLNVFQETDVSGIVQRGLLLYQVAPDIIL